MSYATLLLGACFLAELCTGQSITPAPDASCTFCYLAPGYTDVSSSYGEYLLFTAYSMTSASSHNGLCTTVSGASTALQTPYSVAKPATATADPAQYQSAVATWFINALRVPDWGVCGENGSLAVHMANADTSAVINVAVSTTSRASSLTPPLSPSNTANLAVTQSSLSKPASAGLSARDKAVIGVVVSVVVLTLVVSGLVLWHKYRKQRAAMIQLKIQDKLETDTDKETDFPKGI